MKSKYRKAKDAVAVEAKDEKSKNTYINAPFSLKTAKRIKAIAKDANRSVGRQVVWMVERFMEEQ